MNESIAILSANEQQIVKSQIQQCLVYIDSSTSTIENGISMIPGQPTTQPVKVPSSNDELKIWQNINSSLELISSPIFINNILLIAPFWNKSLTIDEVNYINYLSTTLTNSQTINNNIQNFVTNIWIIINIFYNITPDSNIDYINQYNELASTSLNEILTSNMSGDYYAGLSNTMKLLVDNCGKSVYNTLDIFVTAYKNVPHLTNSSVTLPSKTQPPSAQTTSSIAPTLPPYIPPQPIKPIVTTSKPKNTILGLNPIELFIYTTVLVGLTTYGVVYNKQIIQFIKKLSQKSKLILIIISLWIILCIFFYIRMRLFDNN
jgi:hypothetical protein